MYDQSFAFVQLELRRRGQYADLRVGQFRGDWPGSSSGGRQTSSRRRACAAGRQTSSRPWRLRLPSTGTCFDSRAMGDSRPCRRRQMFGRDDRLRALDRSELPRLSLRRKCVGSRATTTTTRALHRAKAHAPDRCRRLHPTTDARRDARRPIRDSPQPTVAARE